MKKLINSKNIMNLFLILSCLILALSFLFKLQKTIIIFSTIFLFLLTYLQFWKLYKEGKERGSGRKAFPKYVKKIDELNKEQLDILLRLVRLQKKFALSYSLFILVTILSIWLLLEIDKLYSIWTILFFIIIIPPALYIANKFAYPIRKLQFELLARQNLTINFYNNPLWKRITFIIIVIVLIVAYFFGFMYLVKIQKYTFIFPYILILFGVILIFGYILSIKKERILRNILK